MKESPFYIGWMPHAPKQLIKHSRLVVVLLLVGGVIAGALIGMNQKRFSTASFEFGSLTELEGRYALYPVPHLRVRSEPDLFGNYAYKTIPLVGFGKHGAAGVMESLLRGRGVKEEEAFVKLKGTLLYNDGKTLFQIDENDQPLIDVDAQKDLAAYKVTTEDLGYRTVQGEIVDPKCFFGVMKPGEGKVHKDCAIRCILGGIPPVLRISGEDKKQEYFLLAGNAGVSVRNEVKDVVAEPVRVQARVMKLDDWTILYIENQAISRISVRQLENPNEEVLACASSCSR